MTLPSGRSLAYVRPRIGIDERFNKEQLSYEGIDAGNQWGRILRMEGSSRKTVSRQ